MTQTAERTRDTTEETGLWRPPRKWVAYTTTAVLAIVLATLQALWIGFSFVNDEETKYRQGVAGVLGKTAVLAFLGLVVGATVRRVDGSPRASLVAARLAVAALVLAEVYVALKLGPLSPSFD
ncbi:MAG TPA: hypothetical protein VGX28_02440 [Frankiaceae bacterium]|jgi:hypothetical protein|nr:hypothetical protein [Frankiaceae bacterium]